MAFGVLLTVLALAFQSSGKVLYGTFLGGIPTPVFVVLGVSLTAAVFLVVAGFRMPEKGRRLLAETNVWTAICFISVFYALKHLPPAIFASIEIGLALVTAMALTAVQTGTRPPAARVLACIGIIAGCSLLAFAEIRATDPSASGTVMWTAILAAMATGVTTALAAVSCKKLSALGWSSATVLGHRFYLTIAAAFGWIAFDGGDVGNLDAGGLSAVLAIGAVGLVAPLLLLQIAIRRIDALTLMVCLATQPLLSFALSLPSPSYDWNPVTLIGVAIVTAFVAADIAAQRGGGAKTTAVTGPASARPAS